MATVFMNLSLRGPRPYYADGYECWLSPSHHPALLIAGGEPSKGFQFCDQDARIVGVT